MTDRIFALALGLCATSAFATENQAELTSTRGDRIVVTYETNRIQGNKSLIINAQITSIDVTPRDPMQLTAEAYVDGKLVVLYCNNYDVCKSGDLSGNGELNLELYGASYNQKSHYYQHYLSVRMKNGPWMLDPMRTREDGSNDTTFQIELNDNN